MVSFYLDSNLLGSVIGLRARCQELEDSVEELYAENAELRCDKSLTSATTASVTPLLFHYHVLVMQLLMP